ncbi:MAG TPA: LamG-like jellyroll fold domain-containing protein, partial [Verrucomicrobiae bacterium]|nr:LamG-like jellyroll fold domain-containing protein [Verrucomicrobiae bacterium]
WLSGLSPTPGTWAFAAIAIGPTEATLYMDDSLGGGLQSAVNVLNATGMAMETPFWIGADASTSFKNFRNFNGQIDEVAYFKRTLSSAEIQLIHDVLYLGPATLTISKDPSGVTLTWSRGTLQSAPTVSGPWAEEGSAISPYQPGIGGTQKYFRLKL